MCKTFYEHFFANIASRQKITKPTRNQRKAAFVQKNAAVNCLTKLTPERVVAKIGYNTQTMNIIRTMTSVLLSQNH